jgi:outer membrane lipoprotein-sorting protein
MIGLSASSLEKLPYIQTMHHKRTNALVAALAPVVLFSACMATGPQAHGQGAPAPQTAPPAGLAAARPAEPAAEPATEAEKKIDDAIKQLAAIKSVSADFVQSVDMLKQKFDITGRYLKAPTSRIYLKLTINGLPDSSGTLLQICDGETLWDYQQILESKMFRKLSIKPVFERLNSPDMDPKTRDQAMTQMGFAGPEALLLGLRKAVKFNEKEEGTLDGKPVWILRGVWRSRNGLVGPDQRPLPPTGPLPAFVPSIANLYVGKSDGWPYKIELLGKVPTILIDNRLRDREGRIIGSKSSIERVDACSVVLTYSNVKIEPNPPMRADEFAFQAPPNTPVDDSTDAIIKGLDQAIQMQALQKRAEANRQDGPVLDQAIDIPKPPIEPTPK